MFAIATAALAFSAPPSAVTTRREAIVSILGAGAAFGLAPPAARAEYYGAPPPKARGAEYKEALEEAKAYKYAARPDAAGSESAEFKAAAAKREAAAAARAAGKTVEKTDTVNDDLARLGLKPFSG